MVNETDPKLIARLETDDAGRPVMHEASSGLRHYGVVFEVENAPSDAYAATFDLDPETYYDPSRTLSRDDDGRFRLHTTTYGDYPVMVKLWRSDGANVALSASVARGLRASHATSIASPDMQDALVYIAEH